LQPCLVRRGTARYVTCRAPLACFSRAVCPQGLCKGRQAALQQTKHLGKKGDSTEEKEQTECSVLCMCECV